MKLELKHILIYANYNLNFLINKVICELEGFDFYQKNTIIAERVNYKFTEIKLILRPFSEYSSILEITEEMTDFEIQMIEENPDLLFRLSYDVINLMCKHHIDIYGLINHGLAIDINNLKKYL